MRIVMGFLDMLFGKKKEKPSINEQNIDNNPKVEIDSDISENNPSYKKIKVNTVKKELRENIDFYINQIWNYVNTLSENKKGRANDWVKFNILHIETEPGIVFGTTRYNGETNRNGVKGISLLNEKEEHYIDLTKNLWKEYEKNINKDNLFWIGFSDGESVRIRVYKGKIGLKDLESLLKLMNQWLSDGDFRMKLYKEVEKLNLPDEEVIYEKITSNEGYDYYYNGKYLIAGVSRYVEEPFITFGLAKKEPENKFNNKAVALYTIEGFKVGYISEKELDSFIKQTKNEDNIPVVLEAHYWNDKLYGRCYTFSKSIDEYDYMINQYEQEYERNYKTL